MYDRRAASGLPELGRLASTVETWWPEILAFIHTGITNASSEGINRLIKNVARDAYGFLQPRKPVVTHSLRHHPTKPRIPQPRLTSKSHYPAGLYLRGARGSVASGPPKDPNSVQA
ncbi:transposase [Microbispora rosea]|uniref:transposase n=1 Tax=Microbispora rosea TaxID=58117 RepID=UPI0018CC4B5B